MSLQRITRVQVLIVGAAVIAVVAVVFLFVLIKPQLADIAAIVSSAEENEQYAATRPQKEQARATALEQERQVTEEWDEIVDTRMPDIGPHLLKDPIAATLRFWDLPAEEEAVIRNWFNDSGAVVTGYGFPTWPTAMPSSFPPRNMLALSPLDWNLSVSVDDLPELLDWVLSIPRAPRFMVMHSVTIQGSHGPGQPLVASVPVTLYQWTGVEPTGGGAAPAEGTAAQAGGGMGPGMGGGMRGGGMRGGGMRGGGMRGGGMRGGGMRGGGMRGGGMRGGMRGGGMR